MARRLAVLVGVLALMVVVAAPAPAQTPGERVEATGALQRAGSDAGYDYYDITDEATGAPYLLRSESTELGSYEDQRVKISGTLRVEELFEERVRSAYVEVDRVEPADGPDQRVRVTFELTVKGEPPAGTVFVGLLGGEPVPLKLTDPDGDRVYEYTTPPMPASAGDSAVPARIAWGEGPLHSGATGPYLAGPISTIKDFGPVTPGQDTTLSATASFEDEAEGAKISDSAQKAAQEEDAGRSVEATGLIEEPEITTYQYGTHAVTDEASGERYALVEEEEGLLDRYVGERATVSGATAPGFEEGGLEGGPPLVRVSGGEPAADGAPGETSTGAPQPETGVDLNEDGAVNARDGQLAAAISDAAMQADRAFAVRTLPATGGAPPFYLHLVGLAGTLLAAVGLLARRVSR